MTAKKHWLWKQWRLGGEWTACLQVGPWWSIVFVLYLDVPSVEVGLLFVNFAIGRYDALDRSTLDEETGEWTFNDPTTTGCSNTWTDIRKEASRDNAD